MTNKRWTVNDIQEAVRATGSHWFDPDTMRFFGTSVLPSTYAGPGGIYFLTRDERYSGTMGYTVRAFDPSTASVDTLGGSDNLATYDTAAEAAKAAREAAGAAHVETAQDYRAVTILEKFLADCEKHGARNERAAKQIIKDAASHQKMMEDYCSIPVDFYDRDGNPIGRLARCRERIEAAAQELGAKAVKFSGDPRGRTVRLVWNDGATNDWGSEGWIVPTSLEQEAE